MPPLKHSAAGRLPLITWEPFLLSTNDKSFNEGTPLPADMYREIGKRGFTQRIPPNDKYVPMAVAIQAAGLPVVFMEGSGGPGPVTPGTNYQHQLPTNYALGKDEGAYNCPLLLEGWQARADRLRATLRKFKDAGVRVTAAWLDWEDEPWALPDRRRQAAACSRCRAQFPPGVLDSQEDYDRFIVRLKRDILSAYLAAPVREVYPECSVCNWALVLSSSERPTRSVWGNRQSPPADLGFFNAANPVVYGNTIYRDYHWKKEWGWPLDVAHMDRLYTEIMLANISDHAANAQRLAPWTQSIPWVDRYCPDVEDASIPILSRERYREILRHCWLRGTDSMQVFNALRPEHPVIATEEIEDAVAVYDEVLEYREFLEKGWILNTEAPKAQDEGAIWSGLRLGEQAVIRAFTQAASAAPFTVKPWDDAPATSLKAPPGGRTWLLVREGGKVLVKDAGAGTASP